MRFPEGADPFFPSHASIGDRERIATPCLSPDGLSWGIPKRNYGHGSRDEMLKITSIKVSVASWTDELFDTLLGATSAHRNIDRVALIGPL